MSGRDFIIPIVKLQIPVHPLKPVTPSIHTQLPSYAPLLTETTEDYFCGLEEAVYRLQCYNLEENTLERRILYGLGEQHPENCIIRAEEIEKDVGEEVELNRKAYEKGYGELATRVEQRIRWLVERQKELREQAQRTFKYQATILQLLKPDGLYIEGVSSPYRTYLPDIPILYLDENSEVYDEFTQRFWRLESIPDYKDMGELELQRRREREIWRSRILETIDQFRRPLIIAGCNHLDNGFGLVDLLKANGITLHVLNPIFG